MGGQQVNPLTVVQTVQSVEFLSGAVAGFAGLVVLLSVSLLRRNWGLVWAAAVVSATSILGMADWAVIQPAISRRAWILPLLVAALVLGGIGLLRSAPPYPALSAAMVVAGVWATVPDTERITIQLGVTASMLWISWPVGIAKVGRLGALLLPVVVCWAGVIGGVGRDGSVMGALGVVGTLAWFLLPDRLRPRNGVHGVLFHALLVVVWSRIAGMAESAATAAVLGVTISVGLVSALGFLLHIRGGHGAAHDVN
jgi:hypothetical protein